MPRGCAPGDGMCCDPTLRSRDDLMTADDVAKAIVFLVDNTLITGRLLVRDGGIRCTAGA